MRRSIVMALLVLAPSAASAQQSVNFFVGGFTPRSAGARPGTDVLVNNLKPDPTNPNVLAFEVRDFNGAAFGGEWLVGLGNNFEAGVGASFYQRSVPSVNLKSVNANGAEIEQTLKLRLVPFTATFRFLPLGRHNSIEPYIGGGVGVLSWRYAESGDWVDASKAIFQQTYTGSGSTTGPLFLGGIRVPIGSLGVGGEIRYQAAEGTLPTDQFFSGPKIDLGGMTYLFTIQVKF